MTTLATDSSRSSKQRPEADRSKPLHAKSRQQTSRTSHARFATNILGHQSNRNFMGRARGAVGAAESRQRSRVAMSLGAMERNKLRGQPELQRLSYIRFDDCIVAGEIGDRARDTQHTRRPARAQKLARHRLAEQALTGCIERARAL